MVEKRKKGKQNKNSAKNSTKNNGKKHYDEQKAESEKSRGVVLMLLGLVFGLWFAVNFCGNIISDLVIGKKALLVVSLICNIGVAFIVVYYGVALFRQKTMRASGWQLTGWLCLFLSVAAMLHLPNCGTGFSFAALKNAFLTACFGFGGGICGLVPAYIIHFIPSVQIQYVILGAVAILGIMLGSDMKVVDKAVEIFERNPEKTAAKQAKRDAANAKKAAREVKKAQKAEAKAAKQAAKAEEKHETANAETPVTASTESKKDTAELNRQDVDDSLVHDSKDDSFLISPIITDYHNPNPNRELGAIDLDSFQEQDSVYVGNQYKSLADMASLDDFNADIIDESQVKNHSVEYGETNPFDDSVAEYGNTGDVLPEENSVYEACDTVAEDTEKPSSKGESVAAVPKEPISSVDDKKHIEENEGVKTEPIVRKVPYKLPPVSLLTGGPKGTAVNNRKLKDDSAVLENVLASFGVKAKVVEVICGPAVIRYELQPAMGVKVSKIVNLQDDIALALAAKGLRIEAPVPGKSVIGIEVAKPEISAVYFKDVVNSQAFRESKSKLSIAFGIDINGSPVIGDLAKMPHLLIAGSTGSGKSVCMNTLICSLLYKAKPDEVKIIMIDPKKVELAGYNGLPHLAHPVVTDPKKAALVLKEVVNEMDRRYTVFTTCGVKNFQGYNEICGDENRLPQIVVLIDELADLMMVASRDVESHIVRLTQLARAAGIHLVIATQRPSVDVITGLIKNNIPSRIAFAVSSMVDSRTILDMGGAEKLLGRGDMLYNPVGLAKPIRVQGAFVSESETEKLVEFCSRQATQEFLEFPSDADITEDEPGGDNRFEDELFVDACKMIFESGQASASYLQRKFRIGYNRAARLVEDMEDMGIISPPDGKKRKVLMTETEFTAKYLSGNAKEEYPCTDDF